MTGSTTVRSVGLFLVVFVGALALALWLARPFPAAPGSATDERTVRIFQVPVDRADAIATSLRAMLFTAHERAAPLGNASVVAPGQLLVSAPATMQESIAAAVAELSSGGSVAGGADNAVPVLVDLWVLGTGPAGEPDDPQLAVAAPALEAARGSLGLGSFRLLRRAAVVGALDASRIVLSDDRVSGNLRLSTGEGDTIIAEVELRLPRDNGSFQSRIPLQAERWHVLGLWDGSNHDQQEPEQRIVLIRASRLQGSDPVPTAR